MRRTPAGLPAAARPGLPRRRLDLGGRAGQGHPVRLQGLHPGRRAGPVRPPEGHQHRLRRRADPPRPAAWLPDRGRADPVVRQARLADAAPGRAWRSGSPGTCSGSRSSIGVAEPERDVPAGCRRSPLGGLVIFVGLVLLSAGSTLGYDYHAYANAADRLLHGQPLYDSSVDVAGGFAIYLYPPPFVLLALPFALLPASVAPVGLDRARWPRPSWPASPSCRSGARSAGRSSCSAGCPGRWPTRSSWARSGRSCSCCSRPAGAGSTDPAGWARQSRWARSSRSSRRSCSAGRP